ncbi:MAG: NAD-dependent epimerase/dehydratase family protein [Acidobacteria bacterium]|nr:NAD-dependent epimerase/dehydratase family protein [Acidobacteriota bacterium]
MMKILITGSSGLIGSESVRYFYNRGDSVVGVDNNLRRYFFGPDGDTTSIKLRLLKELPQYRIVEADIRDRRAMQDLIKSEFPDAIIHCAAQPSHDWAKKEPETDFAINAVGTMNLLEATRQHSKDACFIYMSTNKVYGDAPNEISLKELSSRWDYTDSKYFNGIDETMRLDRSTHSIFGASKVAADIMVQEYGRYFGMKTVTFRGGCLTGPSHASAELHGFLAYVVKCAVEGRHYTVFGYKGKQVRDNIHSADVVNAFAEYIKDPDPGAVYNLGGGRANSISVLEAINEVQSRVGRQLSYTITDVNRVGDHQCYITDMSAFRARYPKWNVSISIRQILDEMCSEALKNAQR